MDDSQRLEAILRKHGFQIGVTTKEDSAAINGMLADLYAMFPRYGRPMKPDGEQQP